jgi:hypothetical protein
MQATYGTNLVATTTNDPDDLLHALMNELNSMKEIEVLYRTPYRVIGKIRREIDIVDTVISFDMRYSPFENNRIYLDIRFLSGVYTVYLDTVYPFLQRLDEIGLILQVLLEEEDWRREVMERILEHLETDAQTIRDALDSEIK